MIAELVDQLVMITALDNEVGSVLHPHVIAKGILARTLEGRTIATVGSTVVLPCDVVNTLGIHAAIAGVHEDRRLTLGDGVCGPSLGSHASLNEELAVVGELVWHLETESILHYELATSTDAKALEDRGCIKFDNLLTLHSRRIAHGDCYRGSIGSGGT